MVIKLLTSDGQTFEAPDSLRHASVTLSNVCDELMDPDEIVPLPEVAAQELRLILDFFAKTYDDPEATTEHHVGYFADLDDPRAVLRVMKAANYLACDCILESAGLSIARLIESLSVEEIRQKLGIENDFTPEEEEQIRRDCAWAFSE